MIQGIHHIHFHVGNALQTAHFYRDKFGFRWHSYRGPQQQQRHCTSHVMQQGDIRLMFSSYIVPPTSCSSSSSSGAGTALTEREQTDTRGFFERLAAQGDSVHDVAFTVSDVRSVFERAVSHGATVVQEPHRIPVQANGGGNDDEDDEGEESTASGYVEMATVRTPFGRWHHSLIDTSHLPPGVFLPGYASTEDRNDTHRTAAGAAEEAGDRPEEHFRYIDHLAIAIEKDQLRQVVQWYDKVFRFERFINDDEDSETGLAVQEAGNGTAEHTSPTAQGSDGGGLRTMVVCPAGDDVNGGGDDDDSDNSGEQQQRFKFVFVEPINIGHQRSQIQEFIDFHGGPGVAHIAFYTDDIIGAVSSAALRGIKFVDVPHTYYDIWRREKSEAHALVREDWQQLERWKILVDFQKKSLPSNGGKQFKYLLQTFSEPLTDRPTYYVEFISRRKGFSGFGKGNITALFQAIYRLQKERGNSTME